MSVALDWQGGDPSVRLHRRHLTVVPYVVLEPGRGKLTRRGRLVRTLVFCTILLSVLLWRFAPVSGPIGLTVDRGVTVRSGQSLSDIAAEQLPGVTIDEGVRRLRLVNDLPGTGVYVGQPLLIPVER